ncbi:hypothetical protein PGB90_007131 [Kerria lacca]
MCPWPTRSRVLKSPQVNRSCMTMRRKRIVDIMHSLTEVRRVRKWMLFGWRSEEEF